MAQIFNRGTRPRGQSVIVSLKHYNQDKMQYGVPVNRTTTGQSSEISNIQMKFDDIHMESIYSSDNESGYRGRSGIDAQRTTAFQQAAELTNGNPFDQSCNGSPSQMTKLRPAQTWLKRLWKKHSRKVVVAILVTYFVIFILYDAYSGMLGDDKSSLTKNEKDGDSKKSNFQLDQERIMLLAQKQTEKETQEQLALQDVKSKSAKQPKSASQLAQTSSRQNPPVNRQHKLRASNPASSNSIYTGHHLTEGLEQYKCSYVDMFAEDPESKRLTLTYDSQNTFCQIQDVDPLTRCCRVDKTVHINLLSCNEVTKCCESMPECVAHCSLDQLQQAGLGSIEDQAEIFASCEQQCRITSKSVNHNRYFNDEQNKFCHGEIEHEKLTVMRAFEGESCDSACGRLATPLSGPDSYQCSVAGLHDLNQCGALKEEYGCDVCVSDFNTSGPGLKVTSASVRSALKETSDDTKRKLVEDGSAACVVASHSMLLNCDSSQESMQRLCSCVPKYEKTQFLRDGFLSANLIPDLN